MTVYSLDVLLFLFGTSLLFHVQFTSWQIDGETIERVRDFIWGAPKSLQMVNAAMKLRHLLLGEKL